MPPELDVGSLDFDFFNERLSHVCTIAFADANVPLTIDNVEKARGESRPDHGFSVVFKGGEGYVLPQGTYEIMFDESTVAPLFIVPIAENTYEAVFTRFEA